MSIDFGHVLIHSLEDTLKMLPFLFVAYLAIEYLERRQGPAVERILSRGGRFGFIPGAALGIVPQCGFSAMAANFYSSRVITLGTLVAVFLATSDEAIPIMLANPRSYPKMIMLIAVKFGYAVLVGFLLDVVLRRVIPEGLRGGYEGRAQDVDCHGEHEHDIEHDSGWKSILRDALAHTFSIWVWVYLFTFAFGLLVEAIGHAAIADFLSGIGILQPVVAALFGMIPNCASSVLLTQLFLNGSITFGSVLAGLCTNAGIGLTILFRTNKSLRQNLFILGLLYGLGLLLGLVVHVAGIGV